MQNPALGGKDTLRVPSARSLMSIAVLSVTVPGFASVSHAATQVGARVAIAASASSQDAAGSDTKENAKKTPAHRLVVQEFGPQLNEYRPAVSKSLGADFKTIETSDSLFASPRIDITVPSLSTVASDSVTVP